MVFPAIGELFTDPTMYLIWAVTLVLAVPLARRAMKKRAMPSYYLTDRAMRTLPRFGVQYCFSWSYQRLEEGLVLPPKLLLVRLSPRWYEIRHEDYGDMPAVTIRWDDNSRKWNAEHSHAMVMGIFGPDQVRNHQ